MHSPLISPDRLARLSWRARRGLLENDLILTRFFNAHTDLSEDDAHGLETLFALTDNELLDLILARKDLEGALDQPHVVQVLYKLRDV
jgi:antitoxin CptB